MTSRLRRLRAPAAVIAGFVVAGIVLEKANAFPLLRVALNRTPGRIPSTLVLPRDDLDRRVSTVSLYVPNRDLYDLDTGILSHKLQHGRQWERQGWISFFERGQLTFGGSAGVRVHGGGSRTISWPQSFRLYFRKQYGTTALPGAVAFGGDHTHALKRLILHNDMRPWQSMDNRAHLINPLAYDIARAMGNITPETRPVRFYLNGTFQGVYVLTEHFDVRDFFEPHGGRRAYMNDDQLDRLWSRVQDVTPLTMRTIAPLVDIDNLTRWFIAMVFCGTLDAYQGPGQFYQPERTPAPWFWVTWDMDHSFQLEALDSFAGLLEAPGQRRGRRANEPRPRILTTLLRDDPEYREYFKTVWVELMNFAVTRDFVRERFAYYAAQNLALGVPDSEYLPRVRQFLEHRPAIIRAHAAHWLGTEPMLRLQVWSGGRSFTVDSHAVESGWEGYYFPGMSVRVSATRAGDIRPVHWRVNGQLVSGSEVAIRMDRDTVIQAEED